MHKLCSITRVSTRSKVTWLKPPLVLVNLLPKFAKWTYWKSLTVKWSPNLSSLRTSAICTPLYFKPVKPPVENEDPAYFCMSGLSPDRLQVTPDSRTLMISMTSGWRSWRPRISDLSLLVTGIFLRVLLNRTGLIKIAQVQIEETNCII